MVFLENDDSDRACSEGDADVGVNGDGGAVGCPPGVGAPIPSSAATGVSSSCEVSILLRVTTINTREHYEWCCNGLRVLLVLMVLRGTAVLRVLMYFRGCCRYFSFLSFLRSYPISSSRRHTPAAALRSHRGCFLLPLTIHPYRSGRCYSERGKLDTLSGICFASPLWRVPAFYKHQKKNF